MQQAKRLGLRAAMLIVGVNIWTGSPLLAVWIGSRLQGSGQPTMGPIFAVVVVFALTSFALAFVLSRLGAEYDRITGKQATVHRQVPWLRSMRGERPVYPGERAETSALEQTLVLMVVACAIAFEIWFFFFSGSPI